MGVAPSIGLHSKSENGMTQEIPRWGLELRSMITNGGELELSLVEAPTPTPKADEILLRVEAAPINPSDLGLLLGPADLASPLRRARPCPGREGEPAADKYETRGRARRRVHAGGNEGAGVVVAAGASPAAQALLGKTVADLAARCTRNIAVVAAEHCLRCPTALRRPTARPASSTRSPRSAWSRR